MQPRSCARELKPQSPIFISSQTAGLVWIKLVWWHYSFGLPQRSDPNPLLPQKAGVFVCVSKTYVKAPPHAKGTIRGLQHELFRGRNKRGLEKLKILKLSPACFGKKRKEVGTRLNQC